MVQYIDKDALVAEIEKLIDEIYAGRPFDSLSREQQVALWYVKSIMSSINTLEVKEVDLEKETKKWWKERLHLNPENQLWMDAHQSIVFAKHFFELGLNTQQNININITNIDKVIEENGVDPNSKEAKMFKESYYMTLEKLKAQKGE